MIDMTVLFNENDGESLYSQLYQHIKKEILNGKLAAKTRLPSIRSLSSHLHISRNTVDLAYQQLLAEGYVQSRPRSGLYVNDLELETLPLLHLNNMTSLNIDVPNSTSIHYDFRYGDIDADHFPFATWRKLSNQSLHQNQLELCSYGDPLGEPGLRLEIANYLHSSRGVNCSPDQIMVGAGIQYLLGVLSGLLGANNNDSIAMEDPGYDGARTIFQHNGLKIHPIPLDDDGLNLHKLYDSTSRIVYITPSHQFPYGMVMPLAKRMQLLKWAKDENGIIIEDDYDSEFRYVGKPIPSLQGLDTSRRTVYLGTFSKCLLPSLRIAYMVLPPALLDIHSKIGYQLYDQTVSRFHQKTLEMFMRNGHWEAHIRKMRNVYRQKQTTLVSNIQTMFGSKATIIGQDAGLHILLRVHNGMDENTLIQTAESEGTRVYPVSQFWAQRTAAESSMVQIGFGGLNNEDIVKGVLCLQRAWFS
ncbi:PLP-dependent aminotransferase family protein [Paenibacillus sp. L3-i20]|uniref:MocR-like pyridoxine biosynthesis transcription factor PdxR n=1 Tax=Paenibacillus sp. L3-i20 TaxID=2905833 RepID=UPI001EDE166D|nr:PLP-dependent aminotransferase family protein [Paenibacillus sp. L3-i20]GKU80078.1 GntR family transcriptional regulator [Paenibacillus sp. L3-i20]